MITKEELKEWLETAPQKQVRQLANMMMALMTDAQIRKVDGLFSTKITLAIPEPLKQKDELKSIKNMDFSEDDQNDEDDESEDDDTFINDALDDDSDDDHLDNLNIAEEEFEEVTKRKPSQ